ncbi:hypothetical protein M3J09_010289 [Ascochyta lentis]
MLSCTWNRYHQTFAAPHNLFRVSAEKELKFLLEASNKDKSMLLIQPRKRTRAIFEQSITEPPELRQTEKILSRDTQEVLKCSDIGKTRDDYDGLYKNRISAMSIEQLQEISILVSNRIQIKKRYNNTPLRRIITRQVSQDIPQSSSRPESDTFSQSDTLVNTEPHEIVKESPESIQARYNSTPLRRILSRQASAEKGPADVSSPAVTVASYEARSPETRRASYNDTPLRRIISRQTSGHQYNTHKSNVDRTLTTTPASARNTSPMPIPRSNTPLRRILSRQVSAQAIVTKEDNELSERADSVISPTSPIRSRSTQATAPTHLNSEATSCAYEEEVWKKSAEKPRAQSQKEETEGLAAVQVTVTEITADADRSKRIVVDSKGSPLKRILQRQDSEDWKALARVAAV